MSTHNKTWTRRRSKSIGAQTAIQKQLGAMQIYTRKDSDGFCGVKIINVVSLTGLKEKLIPPIVQFLNSYEEVEDMI